MLRAKARRTGRPFSPVWYRTQGSFTYASTTLQRGRPVLTEAGGTRGGERACSELMAVGGHRTRSAPNLVDYERECAAFSWAAARRLLAGLPEGQGLNIAHEAVDRHAGSARGLARRLPLARTPGRAAARRRTRTLRESSNRFANGARSAWASSPVTGSTPSPGGFPSSTSPPSARSRTRSIFCPLFSAFGPEPIRARLAIGQAKALVTTDVALPAQGGGAPAGRCPT